MLFYKQERIQRGGGEIGQQNISFEVHIRGEIGLTIWANRVRRSGANEGGG